MDHMAAVQRASKKVVAVQNKLKEVTQERNGAIRAARADRYGPSEIAAAAELTPEHVRRICLSDD